MRFANIMLGLYSIVICFILVFYFIRNITYNNRMNRSFIYMCIFNVIMILGDITNWTCEGYGKPWFPVALRVGTFIYYASSAPLLLSFSVYIVEYLSERMKISKWVLRVEKILTSIHLFLIVAAQFNNRFYYFSEANLYVRGEWFWLSQIIPILIYMNFMVVVFVCQKRQKSKEFRCLMFYLVLPALAEGVQIAYYGIACLNVAVTITLLLIFINIQSKRELLIKQQEKELVESRIDIMLMQIQPHFLFNVLTTIRSLCEIDPKRAKETISNFAYFLRENMNALTNKSLIPFEQELKHVHYYLKLEQQRFVGRLHVNLDIQVKDFSIPPLSLQPIVENAVKHGIMMRDEGGTITIGTKETKNAYIITVSDDGIGFLPDEKKEDNRSHVGIQNIKKRLDTMCRGSIEITSIPDKGTVVVIRIEKEE